MVTLRYSDTAVRPIIIRFHPITCNGSAIGTFTVPESAPNGEAYMIWFEPSAYI